MNCEQAMELISAKMDREKVDSAGLDAHLAECANCRTTTDAFQLQDSDLRRAFGPRRTAASSVADRVISELRKKSGPRTIDWLPALVAAAAGFLIAFIVFQPWQPSPEIEELRHRIAQLEKQPAPYTMEPIGALTHATGAIEIKRPGEDWTAMATGGPIQPGCRIRTPDSLCELRMNDGSEVRLNRDTELTIRGNRSFDLVRGQMFSNVAEDEAPFAVDVADTSITAVGTAFDISVNPTETLLTVVDGSTRVKDSAGGEQMVEMGERLTIAGGIMGQKSKVYDLLRATRWINEILALKGYDNQELNARVRKIFAGIGQSKMKYMDVSEIKALGDHCVLPLTRYIQSEESARNRHKRRQAAEILSDVAVPWSVPLLIELLNDKDGQVRFSAAGALHRLTGESQGRSPQGWRNDDWGSCQNTVQRWETWWAKNKRMYPARHRAERVK